MPWFEAEPTEEELLWWNVRQSPPTHLISLWPQPSSPRVDARFRLRHMLNDVIHPSPSRFYVNPDSNDAADPVANPRHENWGWLDLAVVGEGHLAGTTGLDDDGWEFTMDFREHAVLPEDGRAGIELEMVWINPAAEFAMKLIEFPQADVATAYRVRPDELMLQLFSGRVLVSPGWPYNTLVQDFFWRPVSDCYAFPPPGNSGCANFNGIDSWIELTSFTPTVSGSWMYEADLFIRNLTGAWVMCRSDITQSRTGYNNNAGQWRTATVPTTPVAPVNTWFKFRMERRWSVPTSGNMRVFFDDVQVGSFNEPNFTGTYNALGGNRPLPALNRWADMCMKNFLFQDGSQAAPRTILNMPLTENTCDLSPLANHGIPHGMNLPSC